MKDLEKDLLYITFLKNNFSLSYMENGTVDISIEIERDDTFVKIESLLYKEGKRITSLFSLKDREEQFYSENVNVVLFYFLDKELEFMVNFYKDYLMMNIFIEDPKHKVISFGIDHNLIWSDKKHISIDSDDEILLGFLEICLQN